MIIKNGSTAEAAARALMREEKSAHFYTQSGQPRYTKENGKAVTLREARKENLFPSITHIMGVLEQRQLTMYREKQILTASFNLRPADDELLEDYFSRVLVRAREDASEAASLGTGFHAGVEAILTERPWDRNNPLLNIANDWILENVEDVCWLEKILVDRQRRIAGRCDGLLTLKGIGPAVVDWKTRRFRQLKSSFKCGWYKKDLRQIAFYAQNVERIAGPDVAAVNVALNTRELSEPEVKEWNFGERGNALKAVDAINLIWQDESNFVPELEDLK